MLTKDPQCSGDSQSCPHALIVDHALRGGSADEALAAAHLAETLGYSVKIIRWNHDHPVSGIQVKARAFGCAFDP